VYAPVSVRPCINFVRPRINCYFLFSFIDNSVLYAILEYFNPFVAIREIISNSMTIWLAVYRHYQLHQQQIITFFRESSGKIYFSFDGWTSPNQCALYGIICFFRDKDNRLCKLLLGVPEAVRHFGDIIAGEFLMVLRAFGIVA
jgi:hypothetical protein